MAFSRGIQPKEVLRWIAVAPLAFGCAYLARYPIHWIIFSSQHDVTERDDNGNFVLTPLALIDANALEQLATAFVTPLVVIWVGTEIAPRMRFATGIALALLLAFLYGIVGVQIAENISDGVYTPGRWVRLALTVVLCVSGIAVGLLRAYKIATTKISHEAR
jgi:hypothetical protein